MNNVLKAAKLDFALVKPYTLNILFAVLFPVVCTLFNRSLINGVSFAMCFIGMTSNYTFAVSEKNGMERLYSILPVSRKHMVLGRYLFTCTLGMSALVISLIAQPIVLTRFLYVEVTSEDIIAAAITGIVLFTFYTAFLIPGYYKFGVIKGRVFIFIPVAGYLAILMLVYDLKLDSGSKLYAILNDPILYIVTIPFICIIVFALSITLSVKILQNKDI